MAWVVQLTTMTMLPLAPPKIMRPRSAAFPRVLLNSFRWFLESVSSLPLISGVLAALDFSLQLFSTRVLSMPLVRSGAAFLTFLPNSFAPFLKAGPIFSFISQALASFHSRFELFSARFLPLSSVMSIPAFDFSGG
jgi:hypothetical protein